MKKNIFLKPFLKWVGGKRYLLPEIKKRKPKFNTYFEPFLGGGAVLFDLEPENAVVNDINSEIINIYNVIRDDIIPLIEELKKHKNDADYFYEVRELDRNKETYMKLTDVEKAARIIFLNKTCFNGLFRVNSQGEFNAPFGRYTNPDFVNEEVLWAVHEYLSTHTIKFTSGDFHNLLPQIKKWDFVYLDPPYDPISDTSSFTGYNLNGFGRRDQEKLKEFCDEIHRRWARFLLSNSSTDFIKNLYKHKDYKIDIVQVPRSINSDTSKRGKINEVLVYNY